ncbi:MAG: hypothetical protein JXD19_08345 [Deltaproteobacteria bacterium]|nr:hypothetical protein [Deltaproteobacteria bacterium]
MGIEGEERLTLLKELKQQQEKILEEKELLKKKYEGYLSTFPEDAVLRHIYRTLSRLSWDTKDFINYLDVRIMKLAKKIKPRE